ncbi:protein claret segregational-like [Nylanderia fulva]|uniref:protein claret segregational-like n=1 Tax=Nylanderia fulva TaxID=613905 RepID=UPI0010FAEA42|nr:protein claret segregational-like [Nylanderia fulva]XP_029162709.1 protein claret segregational-like [Nylanderia fulva]
MESRLPRPKFTSTKVISTMDANINAKSTNDKVIKEENNNPSSKTLTLKSEMAPTGSLVTRTIKENKPPVPLLRAKTLSTITRLNEMKGVKRGATTMTHTELPKRPFIKPSVTKAIANKPSAKTLTSNTASKVNKVTQNNTDNKLKPWDLRGRLAHTSDKLSVAQQKSKDMESKYNAMQELVNTLKTSETACRTKAEKLEESNNILTSDLQILKAEVSTLQKQQEDLTKDLKESKELCTSITCTLNEFQGKCKAQEVTISEQTIQLTTLKADLEVEKKQNEHLRTVNEQLQVLTYNMDKECRMLHNNIQELKGNIRVFCRVRPRTPKEIEQMKALCSINFIDECTIEVGKLDGSDAISCSGKLRGIKQEFTFDKVFAPKASQEDVFEELSLLVQSALEGYNVCVFAYGQTGSGKTYTMEGQCELQTEGMIPRTVRHIFKEMKQFQLLGWEYRIEASFLEIYNEHIIDLLDSQPKSHEIRMVDSKGQDLYVSNLQIQEIHSPEELHECLRIAQCNRAVAATQSNERSSRSHSVTRIRLIGTHSTKQEVSIGNLNLVDLAGSERLKNEEAVRTTETKNINKSLANLGNVILALLKKQEHIPYRNSKLTHLLMPSLGGNSKTLMLLNISPLDECYNETLNSLRFASNVNNCKIGNVKRSRMVLQNNTN